LFGSDIQDTNCSYFLVLLLVIMASVEMSFRKLTVIKQYKGNLLYQMRPNDVTILALEHKEHPKWTLQYLKIILPMQRPS
jgi:hypothetical protein